MKLMRIGPFCGRKMVQGKCTNGHLSKLPVWKVSNGHECPACLDQTLRDALDKVVLRNGWEIMIRHKFLRPKSLITCWCPEGHLFTAALYRVLKLEACPECERKAAWQAYEARRASPPPPLDGVEFWEAFLAGGSPGNS